MVVAIHGNTTTYMYEENGARLVTQDLTPGQATIFPQGSMHMMMNTGTSSVKPFSKVNRCHEKTITGPFLLENIPGRLLSPLLALVTIKLTDAPISTGCENSQLVSALDHDDPGTVNMGEVFVNGFPFDLVNAAFGQDLASDDVKSKMTPVGTGSNWGPESCLKRCGITKPGA